MPGGKGRKGKGRGGGGPKERGNGKQETKPGGSGPGARNVREETLEEDEKRPMSSAVNPETQTVTGGEEQLHTTKGSEPTPRKPEQGTLKKTGSEAHGEKPKSETADLQSGQSGNSQATSSQRTSSNVAAAENARAGPSTCRDSKGSETSIAKNLQKVHIGTSLVPQELTTRQSNGRNGLHPPKRPDYGKVGRPINLKANFFRIKFSSELTDLYHYDVEITPNKCPRSVKRDVVNAVISKYKESTFQGRHPAFDGEKNLYSRIKLPVGNGNGAAELSVRLPGEDGGKDRDFKVKIQFAGQVSLVELKSYLDGKGNGKVPQDAVQALDIILRQMPSCHFEPVGRSFFPFNDRSAKYLGEGCEVRFGFYQSVRHSQWKTMLINIDVSAKGFYKSQSVIEFLCETLGVRQDALGRRGLEEFDRGKFEKAIRGLRVETTHVATFKRKYTIWGVGKLPSDKVQFDIEDKSGRKIKTTVAEYFKETYKLDLRYPQLPCLQAGQKKDRFLPMEVCNLIPCQKKHLSEQQTANMIRSTARPAPERQQDIEYWAQEMVQTSSKYLRDEFSTVVDPRMVSVCGRVLPAPSIQLGSKEQSQALVPRDGSWDMRNKQFFQGVRIDYWALACFAPFRYCGEDVLMKFADQMARVSSGEGIRMTRDPCYVSYKRGARDVEALFSKWKADCPELQLIIAVLPQKIKELYAEVKRVGDNVLGIPTQCVQSKLVQQAKPQVCANISMKINAKLGGVNHVVDPKVQSFVFREPVIFFGADVTHPAPTENGTPSIAAVVASMDRHASKFSARVRAQRHEKLRGAQEIITDLKTMVRELLIDFYRTNRAKPVRIIFYRDGVSEGQFDQVLVHEVRAVQEACMSLEKEYQPKITFVVVQKRHHTRLFCENRQDMTGTSQNVPAGTTVDSGITHPYEFDFYLCSHFGIQGTSRPTHYHVLYDDNGFTADGLQQLTYQMCHTYARCPRSVSIPSPAYYAHLVAFRARFHLASNGAGRHPGSVDLEVAARAIQVSDNMKTTMYFT